METDIMSVGPSDPINHDQFFIKIHENLGVVKGIPEPIEIPNGLEYGKIYLGSVAHGTSTPPTVISYEEAPPPDNPELIPLLHCSALQIQMLKCPPPSRIFGEDVYLFTMRPDVQVDWSPETELQIIQCHRRIRGQILGVYPEFLRVQVLGAPSLSDKDPVRLELWPRPQMILEDGFYHKLPTESNGSRILRAFLFGEPIRGSEVNLPGEFIEKTGHEEYIHRMCALREPLIFARAPTFSRPTHPIVMAAVNLARDIRTPGQHLLVTPDESFSREVTKRVLEALRHPDFVDVDFVDLGQLMRGHHQNPNVPFGDADYQLNFYLSHAKPRIIIVVTVPTLLSIAHNLNSVQSVQVQMARQLAEPLLYSLLSKFPNAHFGLIGNELSTGPEAPHLSPKAVGNVVGNVVGKARQLFPGVLFREIVRCHPEIVGVIGEIFYGGELIPIVQTPFRDIPFVLAHHDGGQDGGQEQQILKELLAKYPKAQLVSAEELVGGGQAGGQLAGQAGGQKAFQKHRSKVAIICCSKLGSGGLQMALGNLPKLLLLARELHIFVGNLDEMSKADGWKVLVRRALELDVVWVYGGQLDVQDGSQDGQAAEEQAGLAENGQAAEDSGQAAGVSQLAALVERHGWINEAGGQLAAHDGSQADDGQAAAHDGQAAEDSGQVAVVPYQGSVFTKLLANLETVRVGKEHFGDKLDAVFERHGWQNDEASGQDGGQLATLDGSQDIGQDADDQNGGQLAAHDESQDIGQAALVQAADEQAADEKPEAEQTGVGQVAEQSIAGGQVAEEQLAAQDDSQDADQSVEENEQSDPTEDQVDTGQNSDGQAGGQLTPDSRVQAPIETSSEKSMKNGGID